MPRLGQKKRTFLDISTLTYDSFAAFRAIMVNSILVSHLKHPSKVKLNLA